MLMRNYLNDKVRLLMLIDTIKDKRIVGRIKLQKIIYLTQQYLKMNRGNTFEYNFKYYNFGPFCKEVGADVTWLSQETPFIVEKEPQGEQIPWEYITKIDDETKASLPIVSDLFGIDEGDFKSIVNDLNAKDYRLLELCATIVYVNNLAPGHTKDAIKQTVTTLKPSLIDKYFDQAYDYASRFTSLHETSEDQPH